MDDTITEKDLPVIEKEMNRIISENPKITREEISREEAEQLFAHDPLKLELLADIPQTDTVSIYRQSEFVDLCRTALGVCRTDKSFFAHSCIRGLLARRQQSKNDAANLWKGLCFKKGAEQAFSAVERG